MLPYLIAGAIGFVVAKIFEEDEAPKYADGGDVYEKEKPYQVYSPITQNVEGYFENKKEAEQFAEKFEDSIVYDIREEEKVGKEFWYEYHCFESDKSCDAEIWYRSHQKVKVVDVAHWSLDDKEFRYEDGQFRVYIVEWKDGFRYDVFEDELMESKDEFERPDPPKRKGFVSNTTFDGNNPDIRYAGGGEIESVIEQVKLEVDLSYYKQNIQYHSLYPKLKNLNFFDDDEKVTSILVKGFINDVKAKSELVNGKIPLYRALAIKNIEKLNVEKLGIYWSVNEDKTGVFDDEGYEHKEKPNYKSVFIICAEFNTKDIDWQNSFDLYVMNDWMEGEIRVVDGSEAYNLKIKKSGDKKWLNI